MVVLSQKGWVRAAKGREIDATALNYKSGDGYLTQAQGRSNQSAVFLDTTGRTYTCRWRDWPRRAATANR